MEVSIMGSKRRHDWRELAKACEESGLSIWRWCKENNIAYTSCRKWIMRLRKEDGSVTTEKQEISVWGKVETEQALETTFEAYPYQNAAAIKLNYGFWSMEINQGFDQKLLKEIMKVVEAGC
jgi:hypothetical protein